MRRISGSLFRLLLAFIFISALLSSPWSTRAASAQPYARCQALADSTYQLFEDYRAPVQHAWATTSKDTTQALQRVIQMANASIDCLDKDSLFSIVHTYYAEAHALASLKRFDAAFARYERFLDQYGSSPTSFTDSLWVSFMHESRGYVYYWSGNLLGAINDYNQAIRFLPYNPKSDWHRRNTLKRITLQHGLCIIFERVNDLDAARTSCRQAAHLLSDMPNAAGDDYLEEKAASLLMQGDLVLSEPLPIPSDSLTKVLRLAEQARSVIAQQSRADVSSDLAWAHLQSSQAYRLLDSLNLALTYAENARRAGRAADDLTDEGRGERAIGRIRADQGKYKQAGRHLQRALRAFKATNHLDHQHSTLYELGHLSERQGDWMQAVAYYDEAIDVVEQYRRSLTATDWSLHAFNDWQKPYHGVVRALIHQQRPADALQALERSRAQHLHDLRMQTRITRALPASDRLRFDSLTTRLSTIQTRLDAGDVSSTERTELVQERTFLSAERRDMLDLRETPPLLALSDLKARLDTGGRALVSYFIDAEGPDSSAASYAFVLTSDTLHLIPLEVSAADITATMQDVSPLLADGADSPSTITAAQFDLNALYQLYEKVFAPLEPYLPDEAPLTIIPDGPLFRLPFGMLVTSPAPRFAHGTAEYLIRKHPISVDLSASLLPAPGDTINTHDSRLMVLGRTNFSAPTAPAVPAALFSDSNSMPALPDLPGVKHELTGLRRLFDDARVYLNKEARESKLQQTNLDAPILHLASHALIYPSTPLRNAFVLTPDPDAPDPSLRDGLLHVHELRRLNRPLPLVVLSGCGTAWGVINAGEGMRGLQYAFRAIGAQSTLSFLWAADDQAASYLTTTFYRYLKQGYSKDVALQRAQVEYISKHPDRSSPFFWASFTLYGSPQSLSLSTPASSWSASWMLGGLLLLAGTMLYVFARTSSTHRPPDLNA